MLVNWFNIETMLHKFKDLRTEQNGESQLSSPKGSCCVENGIVLWSMSPVFAFESFN